MIELSLIELEKYANEYFDTMLKKDPKFIDNCSDSWIYDAEEWFHMHDNLQNDFISTQSVNDFKNMCRTIWKRHYDELYAYDEYSKIITSGDLFNKIVELQRDLYPAQKYLCHEPWASHLTEEQAKDRLEKFKKLNSWINGALHVLKEITDDLRWEDPVEAVDMANNMAADDIINDICGQ